MAELPRQKKNNKTTKNTDLTAHAQTANVYKHPEAGGVA